MRSVSTQVKHNWEQLGRESPDERNRAILTLRADDASGRRFEEFRQILVTKTRTRALEMKTGFWEMKWSDFKAHHQLRGQDEAQIRQRWDLAVADPRRPVWDRGVKNTRRRLPIYQPQPLTYLPNPDPNPVTPRAPIYAPANAHAHARTRTRTRKGNRYLPSQHTRTRTRKRITKLEACEARQEDLCPREEAHGGERD